MDFNLVDEILNSLKDHPGKQFTANDIAEHIHTSNPEYIAERTKRSAIANNSRDLNTKVGWISQLSAEIGSKNPDLHNHHCRQIVDIYRLHIIPHFAR